MMKHALAISLMLVASRCGDAPSAEARPREPSARFTAMVDSALGHGFRREDQRGRRADVTRIDPAKYWAFAEKDSPAAPAAMFQIGLSDDQYSDVVDLDEWQFDGAAGAEAAVKAISKSGGALRTSFEMHLKGHHALWAEGANVYLIYSRANMFEPAFKRMVALSRGDRP